MSGYADSYDELASHKDEMEHWRWCEYLTVTEAAMLVVGLSPSTWKPIDVKRVQDGEFQAVGSSSCEPSYLHSKEFAPVFRAVSRAVASAELPGQVTYLDPDEHEPFSFEPLSASKREAIVNTPDWEKSLFRLTDFREWMAKKGLKPSFFFPPIDEEATPFADRSHDHFSPELDLAVKAWNALASQQKFKGSPKAAIEAWIDANPDAWLGEDKLSGSAKDRIVTLVNWRKSGGAPSSGG